MVATERRKWLALALLSAVQFMVVLDIAIVNVALPSIKIDLGFSQENLQWVISAYALFFGGFLLLGGRAADLLGRRRLFLAGIVLFTLSSLLAGLAWSEGSLIAARSFQGLGAARVARVRDRAERHVRLGLGANDRLHCGGGRAAGRVRLVGAPTRRAADALRDPPHEDGRGRERRRVDPRDGHVLAVPDADAVHAAGARLLTHEDRRRVSRSRRGRDPLVGGRGAPPEPPRREAGAPHPGGPAVAR